MAIAAVSLLILVTSSVVNAGVIVQETFSGGDVTLNATTAEIFSSAITTAGGSDTWVTGGTTYQADGDVVNTSSQNTAYLSLGSYVNDAMGSATGLFELSATLSPISGTWVTLGFFSSDSPGVNTNFTANGGMATMAYRASGEVDAWAGPATANGVQGSLGLTGDQLFTIGLDFTPAGGYDGASNFGTVTFYEGTAIPANSIGNYTYTSAQSFKALGMTAAGTSTGKVSDLEAKQIPEPTSMVLMLLGAMGLAVIRRRK